jgi:hypothetical protein
VVPSRPRVRPVLLVLVGLGLVVGGVQFAHFAGLTEYLYSVEPTTQAAAMDGAEQASEHWAPAIHQFSELSPTAQNVFLRAHEAPNHEITVQGAEHQVTTLSHTGDTPARPGDGLYYVVYQGSYYEFTLKNPMSPFPLRSLSGYALAAFGILLGIYGGLKHRARARPLLAFGSGVVALLAVDGVTDWWAFNDFATLLAVGTLCAALPAVSVWWLYGADWS